VRKITRIYETIFIVDTNLEDESVDKIVNKYVDLLSKENCEIIKTDKWGRKKFAFAIKKKASGFYVSIEFKGSSQTISKLERVYQLDENILRYLTVSYDKKSYSERESYLQKKLFDSTEKEQVIEDIEIELDDQETSEVIEPEEIPEKSIE
jgi:small subunit ribosomal protein S6